MMDTFLIILQSSFSFFQVHELERRVHVKNECNEDSSALLWLSLVCSAP